MHTLTALTKLASHHAQSLWTFLSLAVVGITHQVLRQYRDTSATAFQFAEVIVGTAEHNITDPALAVSTNTQYTLTITQANLLSLCIQASAEITIKVNSSGSPLDTIVVGTNPGQVSIWTLATDLIGTCPFTGNVTTLYVSNANAGAVSWSLRALCQNPG